MNNEDVFSLIRFAIASNPVGAPIGDISEIIGQEALLKRIDNAIYFIES